jgi:hypothetical protein
VKPGAETAAMPASDLVQMVYYGSRRGDFQLRGGVTRTPYRVPGSGGMVEQAATGRAGVRREDVRWFLLVNAGKDYKVVEPPPKPEPKPVPVPVVAVEDSEAWHLAGE